MSKEEIIEGNILIAEFMGFERNEEPSSDSRAFARLKHWYIEPFGYFDDPDLMYDTSWDWIMPAVGMVINSTALPYTFGEPLAQFEQHKKNILYGLVDIKITPVYTAMIDFIKWHNENQVTNSN